MPSSSSVVAFVIVLIVIIALVVMYYEWQGFANSPVGKALGAVFGDAASFLLWAANHPIWFIVGGVLLYLLWPLASGMSKGAGQGVQEKTKKWINKEQSGEAESKEMANGGTDAKDVPAGEEQPKPSQDAVQLATLETAKGAAADAARAAEPNSPDAVEAQKAEDRAIAASADVSAAYAPKSADDAPDADAAKDWAEIHVMQ